MSQFLSTGHGDTTKSTGRDASVTSWCKKSGV